MGVHTDMDTGLGLWHMRNMEILFKIPTLSLGKRIIVPA